jgi:hypothetical protein
MSVVEINPRQVNDTCNASFIGKYTFPAAKRIIAFGDVHGDYDALVQCLHLGGCVAVVSGQYAWAARTALSYRRLPVHPRMTALLHRFAYSCKRHHCAMGACFVRVS